MEAKKLLTKYPDRVPVIIQKKEHTNLPDLKKCKYLIPKDTNLSQIIYIIRKNINIKPETSIFVFINNTLIPNQNNIGEVYNLYKNTDDFLYIKYTTENTFG